MGSGKRLRYSIRKHGVENHVKEILEFFETREDLSKREIEIVNSDLIKEVNCMNLVLGGGGFMLDDYHYKCSKAGGNVHAKRLIEDDDYLKLHKDKFITIIKEKHKNGCYKYDTFTGKQHSDETKKKMSESSKGMGIGKNNSQYGTCWITKNETNKKINKEDLDSYLNEGWVKGRKY
jgi:hypothetical protein